MRLLGQILLACLLIAVLQGMLAVLAVALVLAILWGLLFRTAETAGFLALLLYLRALELWPALTVGLTVGLVGTFLIARAKDVPAPPNSKCIGRSVSQDGGGPPPAANGS